EKRLRATPSVKPSRGLFSGGFPKTAVFENVINARRNKNERSRRRNDEASTIIFGKVPSALAKKVKSPSGVKILCRNFGLRYLKALMAAAGCTCLRGGFNVLAFSKGTPPDNNKKSNLIMG